MLVYVTHFCTYTTNIDILKTKKYQKQADMGFISYFDHETIGKTMRKVKKIVTIAMRIYAKAKSDTCLM